MKPFQAVLRRRRRETAEAATLELAPTSGRLDYRPGQVVRMDPHQFGALEEALRERAAARGKPDGAAYFALSSDALDPSVVEITVKFRRPEGSPLARFLVEELAEGTSILLDGPEGRYGYPEPLPDGVEAFLHVCAGSGVAPDRGMIRHALGRGWPQRQVLVLQDRTAADVLFAREWEALAGEPRFRFLPVYSRAGGGRVTAERVREAIAGFADPARCVAFVCGPNQSRAGAPGFCDQAREALAAAGVPGDRIRV